MGGTYTLLLAVPASRTVDIGALGRTDLPAGIHAYTGSAQGSGGFARLDRHIARCRADADGGHWHIDHLTGHPAVDVVDAAVTHDDRECAIAAALPGKRITGFGCSDCRCDSHLVHGTWQALAAAVDALHGTWYT